MKPVKQMDYALQLSLTGKDAFVLIKSKYMPWCVRVGLFFSFPLLTSRYYLMFLTESLLVESETVFCCCCSLMIKGLV